MKIIQALLLTVLLFLLADNGALHAVLHGAELDELTGRQVDIASSAYQYRADRKADQNQPESWLALMRYAHQPLNKPVDVKAPAIEQALCGLLWEEVRPVKTLELTWAADAKRRPAPEALAIATLNNRGSASSWWNNLIAVKQAVKPTLSGAGRTYVYDLGKDTCGIVVSVVGDKIAANFDVPTVRTLTADTWKKMEVEIEWGFDAAASEKDYSGRIETYDGVAAGLRPLDGDGDTTAVDSSSWHSAGKIAARRGVKFSLLYMGTSKWRRVQPYTTQRDDVARTIVTLWTKAGNFSFLAADLENGPILAPEYGFFIRQTSESASPAAKALQDRRAQRIPLDGKKNAIGGNPNLLGWGSDSTPWFGGNPTDKAVSVQGIAIPARTLAMHPGPDSNVAVGWRSPFQGQVKIGASVAHAQGGGNGIEWWVTHETKTDHRNLAFGSTDGTGAQTIPVEVDAATLRKVTVEPGDMVSLAVGPKGNHFCDTHVIDLVITELGGQGRVWNLTDEVAKTPHAGNPRADGQGNANVWRFYAEYALPPSEPPFSLASKATTAAEFITELKAKKLSTIRQRTRAHAEQTWEGAVAAMRGNNLPPHPQPPAGAESSMQVLVPSARLTAQWNLGAWHLLRHCEKNPKNGRRWFNDYPYGILAAETYLVLAALDMMGSHQAAEDGLDQWTTLPMDPHSAGHNEGALPDRPSGLFSDGHGCLTHAVGPHGIGGHMDGIHAFGPGSIGWAIVEHYWLTRDAQWLKANAPRIKANADWMLRQRQVVAKMVPGGERLWCKGLLPARQPTPDSGGLWMQVYECEAYYFLFLEQFAKALSAIDPEDGAKLKAEVAAYRKDLLSAVDRSIALSPLAPVRDGTYHSVIPFACYVRGLSTGAWGWQRDGSREHVGPLYWETVQSAAPLISPAGLLSPDDVRVQGYLDVLEDRLLLENANVGNRPWFDAGWQYQGGLERTANMHLLGDDVSVFLRSFLNCYAVDILPNDGYIFNEHAVHGPPDKIFEEAAFLERFRNLLVMEQGDSLWIARAAPRAWFEQGRKISVKNAPSHFGVLSYEIVSDVDRGKINATVEMPARNPPQAVLLRIRHPQATRMKSATVNGRPWKDFDAVAETVRLHDLSGSVKVEANY
ncbi:MAG: hypothetical protein IT426_17900 [Pirellulales bacterium]|nr:hypothetical protein [Pirellulales bacterium]